MLKDLVTVVHNDETSVILKVKEGKEMDLICLGYFMGDETMFRLTKDSRAQNHTCTLWRKNGKSVSWRWGNETTLVSDNLKRIGEIVQETIMLGFGIIIEGKNISKTLGCYDYSTRAKTINVTYWNDNPVRICVRDKDNDFYINHFQDFTALKKKLSEYGYKMTALQKGYSNNTGCNIDSFLLTSL